MIQMVKLEEIQEGYAKVAASRAESRESRALAANMVEIIQELIDWRKNYVMVAGEHAPLPNWVRR